jgi:signal peptidase I
VVLAGAAVVVRLLGPETEEYRLPRESMVRTLPAGSTVTLNRDAYESAGPERGDIVIAHPPRGSATNECGGGTPPAGQMCARPTRERLDATVVQRIAGVPGDALTLPDFPRPITVPDGHYFLLGDNRGASDDSRFWGPVPRDWILGRVDDCDLLRTSCTPVR